jgi:acetoin utilization deacetylase AcuC-like enzyme
MRALCAEELHVPLGAVLEGGYALGALARGVTVTLEELNGRDRPSMPEVGMTSVAEAARDRLRQYWPEI